MLAELHQVMAKELPILLADPHTDWKTLDVLYEDPHVERVWTQLGPNRLYLQRIHPCEKAFFHPHPWQVAVHLLEGQYVMRVGFGPAMGPPPPIAATIDLKAGSSYEMLHRDSWHDVMPYGGPSLSIMFTGRPWVMPTLQHPQKSVNRPLSETVTQDIITSVIRLLPPFRI